jgi:hypothetical protein
MAFPIVCSGCTDFGQAVSGQAIPAAGERKQVVPGPGGGTMEQGMLTTGLKSFSELKLLPPTEQ